MGKILITPRSLNTGGDPSLEALEAAGFELMFCGGGRQPTEDELLAVVPECTGWLAGVEPITSRVLEAAVRLRVISRNGTGIDNIDLDAAKAYHIEIMRAEGANARGVAELAVGLMFALARMIPFSDRNLRSGQWRRSRGVELEGRVLGVIGCGAVGRGVATMAAGLGMNVMAYDLYPDESFDPSPGFQYTAMEELLKSADFISLHTPGSPDRQPIISRTFLAACRPGVFIINTARSGLVDPAAVLDGLRSGAIGGLATDVFDTEPPEMDDLLGHERVILTPHIGGFTIESSTRVNRQAVDNLLRVLGPSSG